MYGALSAAASQADPASLIFENKRLEGFHLTSWLSRKNTLVQLRVTRQVQELLGSDLKTEIQARIPLEEAARALEGYTTHMTAGKILLVP